MGNNIKFMQWNYNEKMHSQKSCNNGAAPFRCTSHFTEWFATMKRQKTRKVNIMQKKIWVGVLALTFAAGNMAFAADEAAVSKAKAGAITWVGNSYFKFKAEGDAECGVNRGCAGVWHDESLRSREETKVGQKVECVSMQSGKVPKKTAYKIAEEQRTQGDTHKAAKGMKVPKKAFDCKAI